MTEITVTGNAQVRVPADRAEITANMTFRDAVRDVVIESAGKAHEGLVARATHLVSSEVASEYVASPVSSYSSSWTNPAGEIVVEYQAAVKVRIMMVSLEQVGEVAAALTAEGADISVSWELSETVQSEHVRALRSAAVESARDAAKDYADALGATTLQMSSLRDESVGGQHSPMPRARMAMAVAEVVPEVTVGEIRVSVGVSATFTAA